MLLQLALVLITALIALFVLAWFLSPELRRKLEEPKFAILPNQSGQSNQSIQSNQSNEGNQSHQLKSDA